MYWYWIVAHFCFNKFEESKKILKDVFWNVVQWTKKEISCPNSKYTAIKIIGSLGRGDKNPVYFMGPYGKESETHDIIF